jgi:hypothetical protein
MRNRCGDKKLQLLMFPTEAPLFAAAIIPKAGSGNIYLQPKGLREPYKVYT